MEGPARGSVPLFEVGAQGPRQSDPLLRVECLVRRLLALTTQERRLEPEQGPGPIERRVRSECEARARSCKAFPGVGSCGPPTPVEAGHGAVGQLMDRLHGCENPEAVESLPILGSG